MGSRARRIAVVLTTLCVAGVVGSSEAFEPPDAAPVMHRARGSGDRPGCDGYRWRVKVLADAGGAGIDPSSRDTTVAALDTLHVRRGGATRIAPIETRVWRLPDVHLVGLERKPDGDIHLVVSDEAGRTMITELPSPACDGAAPPAFRARMDAARSSLLATYGDPGSSFHRLDARAALTGVGFFDFGHQQRGAAPNAIELHPLLSISQPRVQEAVRPPALR